MKTEYSVFKQVEVPGVVVKMSPADSIRNGPDLALGYLPLGSAVTNGPKQAIREVVERLPEKERLGSYRATPTRSWHSAEVTEKLAELAVT